MLAWWEGTGPDVRKPEIMVMTSLWAEGYLLLLRSPSQTCHTKPELNQQAPDATSFFPVGEMPTASNLAWKTSLEKSGRCGIAADWAWRATYDWSWWYPSGNRPLQQYLTLPGAGYGQFEQQGWQPDCKIQRSRAERSEVDVWAESPRLSPLWLSASSSACHGLLIITVITPLPTKPSATKMPENWSWRTRRCNMQCVSVMLRSITKNHGS